MISRAQEFIRIRQRSWRFLSSSRHVAAIRRSDIKEATTKSDVLLSFEKASPPEGLLVLKMSWMVAPSFVICHGRFVGRFDGSKSFDVLCCLLATDLEQSHEIRSEMRLTDDDGCERVDRP